LLNQSNIEIQRSSVLAEIAAQERTLSTIAMELHDNVNQMLSAVKIYLSVLEIKLENEKSTGLEMLNRANKLVTNCISDIRKICLNINVVKNEVGLVLALENVVNELNETDTASISLVIEGSEPDITHHDKLNIIRIVQESLNNSIKYANATEVIVHVVFESKQIKLSVTDNGGGFDSRAKNFTPGLGLKNMQNRANALNAEFEIQSEVSKGTSIKLKMNING